MTTIETLTLDQVQTLSTEAARAGDTDTVTDCELLESSYFAGEFDVGRRGVADARKRIVAVISNAEAQV